MPLMRFVRDRDLHLGILLSILILAVNVLSVASEVGFVHKPKRVHETDQYRYIEMAKGAAGRPELTHEPPYCWRVAIPAVAYTLVRGGVSMNVAFYALAVAAVFGFLLVTWLHLRDLGFTRAFRIAGLLLVGFTQGAVRWSVYQYWMTDAAGIFLLALGVLLLRRRRDLALGTVSLVAAFVRETYVVLYPAYVLRKLRDGLSLRSALLRSAALVAGPVVVLVALRILIRPNQPDDYLSGITDSLGFRWRHIVDEPYVLTVGAIGVLFPLLLLFPSRVFRLVRTHYDQAALFLAVLASLLISNNTERPLAYALPVILPAALLQLRTFIEATRLPATPVLAVVVSLQLFFWSRHLFAQEGMSMYQPTNVGTAVTMASFYLLARLKIERASQAPEA